MIPLTELCGYLDEYLQHPFFSKDVSQNGLQVEGKEQVQTVAYAVDARLKTFEEAAALGAQMLLVHHGLYWGRPILLTGMHYKRFRALLDHELALYASHLPLDAHMEVGNNAVLARKLGLQELTPWSEFRGQTIGIRGEWSEGLEIEELESRLQQAVSEVDGRVQRFGSGPKKIQRVGVITGDAAAQLASAAEAGLDALITGEPCHVTAAMAEEIGAYLLTAGHYATETFGVAALAQHLAQKFEVQTHFIHVPTFA